MLALRLARENLLRIRSQRVAPPSAKAIPSGAPSVSPNPSGAPCKSISSRQTPSIPEARGGRPRGYPHQGQFRCAHPTSAPDQVQKQCGKGALRELCRIRERLELTKLRYKAKNGVVLELGQSPGTKSAGVAEDCGTEPRWMPRWARSASRQLLAGAVGNCAR